jgi:uncharacterized protein YbcV (DUF1398 family)
MFTREQILSALSKVQTGADYPRLVQDLRIIGIRKYDHFVADGSNIYFGDDDYRVTIEHDQVPIHVNNKSSKDLLKQSLKVHQNGETDYPTFCIHAGEAGVEKWTCDLKKMTVSYIDKEDKTLLEETIGS